MEHREILVALLKNKKDFAILRDEGWYRIPVNHTPKRWPPDYIGFYQPKAFEEDAFQIRYFGKVKKIDRVERRDLFPNEIESAKAGTEYHRILIESLIERQNPIYTRLPRSVVFISTTMHKFINAGELNDLFDESPLEDILWEELKHRNVNAERQWLVSKNDRKYYLDFAFFCNGGNLDVETDGDTWHLKKEHVAYDNQRNNDVTSQGWSVLRFNTNQIQDQKNEYCLPNIQDSITRLGGLLQDGLVPRKFIEKNGDSGQQLTLFNDDDDG